MPECIPFDIEKKIVKKVSNVKKSLIRVINRQNHVMPDIPFDIQMEIIKRLPVKPLIRFSLVSKPWKSFTDTSKFIKTYGTPHTEPHSCRFVYLSYRKDYFVFRFVDEAKYICFHDDTNNETPLFKALVVSPLIKQCSIKYLLGSCHGLLCLYGFNRGYEECMLVIWNPSIRKSFGIVVPSTVTSSSFIFGFGVCPVTTDPTVVKATCCILGMLSRVQVFTLTSGVWTDISTSNWSRTSIKLNGSTNVVIDDRFVYWAAFEFTDDDNSGNHMVVSFDLLTKEFRVLDLPKSLTNELYAHSYVSVSKLRESLVVYGCIKVKEALCCVVWLMELDSSFTKLFTIGARVDKILGFRKSGEPLFEDHKSYGGPTTLYVYDPCSQQIKNLGIVGAKGSFFTGPYKESLLLLDHSDLQIYAGDN